MKYSIVLFDLDGTLLDTLEDLNLSMQHTLEHLGLPGCTYKQTKQRVGNGIVRLVERSVPAGSSKELTQRVYDEFVAYYALHADGHTKPYSGVMELLSILKDEGCKIAVVSNKNHEPVCNLVKRHFGDIFDVVLGVQEGLERKPKPDMVQAAMVKIYGSSCAKEQYEHAVYIGDSEVDILTAANAGLPCVSVSWGFRTHEELKRAGASCIVSAPAELLEALRTLDANE